jgi:hypothetical protein
MNNDQINAEGAGAQKELPMPSDFMREMRPRTLF